MKAQRGSIFLQGAFRSLRRRGDLCPGHGSGDMFLRREELRHLPPPAFPYSLSLLVSPVPLRYLSLSSAERGPGLLRWLSLESPGSLPGTRGGAQQAASHGASGKRAGRGKPPCCAAGPGNSGNRPEGAGVTLSRNPGAERITALPWRIGAAAA